MRLSAPSAYLSLVFSASFGLANIVICRVADTLGRRRAMTTECTVFIIGVIVQITSEHAWPQFAVGRLISGLGVGALSAAVPMVSVERFSLPSIIAHMLSLSSIKQRLHLRRFVVR